MPVSLLPEPFQAQGSRWDVEESHLHYILTILDNKIQEFPWHYGIPKKKCHNYFFPLCATFVPLWKKFVRPSYSLLHWQTIKSWSLTIVTTYCLLQHTLKVQQIKFIYFFLPDIWMIQETPPTGSLVVWFISVWLIIYDVLHIVQVICQGKERNFYTYKTCYY